MSGVNCLVIGGGGFIGLHLTQLLAARGRKVIVLGRRAGPTVALPEGAEYVQGDYGDLVTLQALLSRADEVVDLAYATVPKSSFEDPVFDLNSNLPLAVKLLQATADAKRLRRLVLVSSGGTVYGHAESVPIAESFATNPVSPYGITKLAIEKYGLMYHRLIGLPVIVVRPGNAYGEGQLPFRGQGFIATAMAAVLQGRPITVFGGDLITRDYIHAEDVAAGIAAALESGHTGDCYNVGSGVGHSTNRVLSMVCGLAKASNLPVEVREAPARPFDVPINVLNCAKLRSDTGWRSSIELAEGLERTWHWARRTYGTQPT
jgi:UDP-glucose 4-epimerase